MWPSYSEKKLIPMLIQMTDCIHYMYYIHYDRGKFLWVTFKVTSRVNILIKNIAILEINRIPFEGRSKPII